MMMFDFEKFTRFVREAYSNTESSYSLEEVLRVFWLYFKTYELYLGKPHPPIRVRQIERIIEEMPWIDAEDRRGTFDIYPEDYEALIEKHFQTRYQGGCDYNINHFFSGRVREMRYYEEIY